MTKLQVDWQFISGAIRASRTNWLNTKKFYKQLNYNYNVQFKPSANCRKEGRKMAIKRTSFFGERLAAQITEEMFPYIFFYFFIFYFCV